MILETEQQVVAQQQKAEPEFHFATVAEVHSDGLSLYIGAETSPTEKHYKCNTTCKFSAGQKVYIQKAGGEYVVLFPIGAPASEVVADRADRAIVAEELKNTDTNFENIRLKAEYTNEMQYQIKGSSWVKLQNQ